MSKQIHIVQRLGVLRITNKNKQKQQTFTIEHLLRVEIHFSFSKKPHRSPVTPI